MKRKIVFLWFDGLRQCLTCLVIGALVGVSRMALAEGQIAGPKGGRLLESEGMKAEFFIEKDHHVSLTFYNDKLEKIPVTSERATLVAETPSKKRKIEFEIRNGILLTKEPLPKEPGYNIVLQLKKDETGKIKNFRIPFATHLCGECGRAEYACICEGH